MTDNILFKHVRITVSDADVESWIVERDSGGQPQRIKGPCPACGHETETDIDLSVLASVQSGILPLPPASQRVTRVITCACQESHPVPKAPKKVGDADSVEVDPDPDPAESCGRWWLATITLNADGEQEVHAGDPAMLKAARAVEKSIDGEEARVRVSAEKWIAGIAALLPLFGLTGVIAGKDSLSGISDPWPAIAAGVAGLALICAAAAILLSYGAAYDWPVEIDVDDDEKLETWFRDRRERIRGAASDLRNGVFAACATLMLLAAALGIVWFGPRDTPEPLVKVTATTGSFACGHLLKSAKGRVVRVQRDDGTVAAYKAREVSAVAPVKSCS